MPDIGHSPQSASGPIAVFDDKAEFDASEFDVSKQTFVPLFRHKSFSRPTPSKSVLAERIELIRLVGRVIHRLDLMDATNRRRVLAVDSNAALDLIFGIANE